MIEFIQQINKPTEIITKSIGLTIGAYNVLMHGMTHIMYTLIE